MQHDDVHDGEVPTLDRLQPVSDAGHQQDPGHCWPGLHRRSKVLSCTLLIGQKNTGEESAGKHHKYKRINQNVCPKMHIMDVGNKNLGPINDIIIVAPRLLHYLDAIRQHRSLSPEHPPLNLNKRIKTHPLHHVTSDTNLSYVSLAGPAHPPGEISTLSPPDVLFLLQHAIVHSSATPSQRVHCLFLTPRHWIFFCKSGSRRK